MQITDTMDLGQLAERMGSEATREDAERMRSLLVAEHDGEDTSDIGEDAWHRLLCRVAGDPAIVRAFLDLPSTDLPSAVFADTSHSWRTDAWAVLREVAASGEQTCEQVCGSAVIVRADADGWRDRIRIA